MVEKIVTWLEVYLDFIVLLFGAVIGSFLNVCIHRMAPVINRLFTPAAVPLPPIATSASGGSITSRF